AYRDDVAALFRDLAKFPSHLAPGHGQYRRMAALFKHNELVRPALQRACDANEYREIAQLLRGGSATDMLDYARFLEGLRIWIQQHSERTLDIDQALGSPNLAEWKYLSGRWHGADTNARRGFMCAHEGTA